MYSRKWIKYSYNSVGHTYLKQIRKKQLTKSIFENLRIEKKLDFSKAIGHNSKIPRISSSSVFYPLRATTHLQKYWRPTMGAAYGPSFVPFTVGSATNSPILRVFTKKAKALCKGRLIKPAHPRSKARWIPPFPLISAERRSRIAGSPPRKVSL